MGIDGLLALFKPIIKKEHIKSFRNKTLGIDALPWIYKGIYGANMQMGQQKSQHGFLYYILQMIDMLLFYNIKPIFIFDGRNVSAKNKTLQKRKKAKDQNKQKAQISIKNNDTQQGKKYLSRCITIDQKAISLTMNLLVSKGVDFVVAPYQADCQIAKLQKLNIIDAAITEDSDLVIYGVKVILKLKQTGQCDYLDINEKQQNILEGENVFLKKFVQFDRIKKMQAAILAGCDYCESVKGIGLKKAINLVQNHETFQKIVQSLQKDPKLGDKVPQNYLQLVQNAKLIFCLATVYNPNTSKLQQLNPELLDQLVPNDLIQEQLNKIIGIRYQFHQDHYKGKINCKTQQVRSLLGINLKLIYSLNPQNIMFEGIIKEQSEKSQQAVQKPQINVNIIINVIGVPQEKNQLSQIQSNLKENQTNLLDIYEETSVMQGDSICSQNQQILKTIFWNYFIPN